MSAAASSGTQVATIKPCGSSSSKNFRSSKATFATKHEKSSAKRLATCFSTAKQLHGSFTSGPAKSVKAIIRARSAADEDKPLSGLPVDLRGERAFTAGVADDNGYGWAIAKSLAAAGAEILVGTGCLNVLNIFESSLRRGKFDESDCQMEIADSVKQDFGSIHILVYSLAFGPKDFPLLNIFMLRYGAAMSLANSALESDTRIKKVGNATAFRASPLASAITGAVIFVDNGLNAMGVGADSPTFEYLDIPKAK